MLTWPRRPRPNATVARVLAIPAFVPPAADGGLSDRQRERLAIALHERYHGVHVPERGLAECARLSGAYDDVAAIEPIIVGWIRGGR